MVPWCYRKPDSRGVATGQPYWQETRVMQVTKELILQRYGLSPEHLIRKGMEAEVYAFGSGGILKLYNGTTNLAYLTSLQTFYATIDSSALSYSLPYIETVAAEGDICISIERRLPGDPMSEKLPTLTKKQMDYVMHAYLAAARELTKIQIPADFDRYKLFDAEDISRRRDGDWHQFLGRYLSQKLSQVATYLKRDVKNFDLNVQRLYTILAQPYAGNYSVIHGDFFPGNILVDERRRITALLDFGSLTMYGDSLFDIATGWVFFDMYEELKANLRERYLAIILETLGTSVREKLYFYVLLYSLLSANTYSSTCADGHYQWCVENLNNREYWRYIE
jgi:aminoglycoside phosphotransferase